MNFSILWRLYVVVFLLSLILYLTIKHYARVRDWLRKNHWKWLAKHGPQWLAAVVLPRIASWHVLLSQILVHDKNVQVHLDVMTKGNILYQGVLADKTLAADGGLISVVLAEPKRFKYEEYVEAKKQGKPATKATYWKPIPTNMFIITATEIATMNVRYVPEGVAALKLGQDQDNDLQKVLDEVNQMVEQLLKQPGEL
jgi:hypothetical protein